MMNDHYQPLTAGQIHHILKQYQLGTRERPSVWAPADDELEQIEKEGEDVVNKIYILEVELTVRIQLKVTRLVLSSQSNTKE